MIQEELYPTFISQEEDDITEEETPLDLDETPSDEETPLEEGLGDEEI